MEKLYCISGACEGEETYTGNMIEFFLEVTRTALSFFKWIKKIKIKKKIKKTNAGAQKNQGGVICLVVKSVVNLSNYWHWGLKFKLPGVLFFTHMALHFKLYNLAFGTFDNFCWFIL